jgi:pilus assembly protein CpaE
METRTPVAVIDLDRESCQVFVEMLKEMPGVEPLTESQDFYRGLSLIRRFHPAVLILNLHPSEDTALSFARKVSQNYPDTTLFITAKKAPSALILGAMRAGAREFITQPVDKEELFGAVRKALQGRRDASAGRPASAKVVTVFGSKGGIGVTTVAVNLATLLARGGRAGAAVVDLDLQFGDAAILMNVKPRSSIPDLAENAESADAALIRNLLPRSAAGVSLLAGPARIEEAENVTSGHVEKVLTAFRNVFDTVVVDTAHCLNDMTVKAMDESDAVLLLTAPDVPALHQAGRCLELFRKMGFDRERVRLVLNRHGGADDIHPEAVEKLLDYPVSWRLALQDAASMASAVTRGEPIAESQPHSRLAQGLRRMAEQINGAPPAEKRKRTARPPIALIQKLIG